MGHRLASHARRAAAILERLGLDIDRPRRSGGCGPTSSRWSRSLAPCRSWPASLILDEPTSSLPDDQVGVAVRVVRALRDEGVAVVFVSHRMNEIFDIVDRVTVVRDASSSAADRSPGSTAGG